MEVAVRGGVEWIVAQCGGACACGTCHVYIEMVGDRLVAPLGGLEAEMLECVSDRRESSRLACQVRLNSTLDGLVVEVAASQLRSEEHTSELQSLMRISYAVFCLKKQNTQLHPAYTKNT